MVDVPLHGSLLELQLAIVDADVMATTFDGKLLFFFRHLELHCLSEQLT